MSTDNKDSLLPCPFCGGSPDAIERPDNIDGTEFFYAVACYCGGHSACAHKMARRKTAEQAKADAIAAWNRRSIAAGAAAVTEGVKEKIAPVQGYAPGIPWSLHLEAYEAYRKKWSPQPALIDLEGRNCRGGFHVDELDEFIPGWRDKVSEIGKLRAKVAQLEAALAASPLGASAGAQQAREDVIGAAIAWGNTDADDALAMLASELTLSDALSRLAIDAQQSDSVHSSAPGADVGKTLENAPGAGGSEA